MLCQSVYCTLVVSHSTGPTGWALVVCACAPEDTKRILRSNHVTTLPGAFLFPVSISDTVLLTVTNQTLPWKSDWVRTQYSYKELRSSQVGSPNSGQMLLLTFHCTCLSRTSFSRSYIFTFQLHTQQFWMLIIVPFPDSQSRDSLGMRIESWEVHVTVYLKQFSR